MRPRPRPSRPRHRRPTGAWRRVPVLGAASLLLVGGGSGLLALSLSDGPAGADSTLGGFTVSALAEAVTAQYEQPNFPVPATPSLEFDEGYAATSDNFGPSGTAVASTLYPGQVVANAGPQLALLVPGAPLPPAPIWPVEATSEYPQSPNTASTDEPGLNMDTASSSNGNTASATLGTDSPTAGASGIGVVPTAPSGTGNPFASSSSLMGIGSMSAASSSEAPSTNASGQASATLSGVEFLGGFINIGSITSTANAVSDGTTGKVSGDTTVQNMTIAGTPVTVDANGIHAQGQTAPTSIPISSINTLLNELGISVSLTNPTDAVQGPSASRTLDGLRFTIDLKTLDDAANKFASLFPPSFTSQLPFALPNDQQLTLDLATVQVQSTASPSFVAGNSGNTGAGSSSGIDSASTSPAFTGSTGAGGTFTGSTGAGSFSSPGSGAGSAAPSGSGAPAASASEPASTVTPAFKGIGSALILLGLLAAAAMAYLYKRADDATEMLTTACADGDPVGERFTASADDLNQFGG